MAPIRVIKIGGSLLQRDNLLADLRCWQTSLVESLVNAWITGGGTVVEAIRQRDQTHRLSDSDAHWSSIEAMDVNARLLASQLPDWTLTSGPEDLLLAARDSRLLDSRNSLRESSVNFAERKATMAKQTATMPTHNFILQTKDWLIASERELNSSSRLPHSWDVTSDSIAAWASIQLHATELILLKSCDVSETTVAELTGLGIVDAYLPTLNPQLQNLSFTCQQLPHSCR